MRARRHGQRGRSQRRASRIAAALKAPPPVLRVDERLGDGRAGEPVEERKDLVPDEDHAAGELPIRQRSPRDTGAHALLSNAQEPRGAGHVEQLTIEASAPCGLSSTLARRRAG
jgi:hypothetical protein